MKKNLIILLAAIALAPMANAQFYGVSSTGRGGQIALYGGIASTTASPKFLQSITYIDSWNQTWTDWAEVEAEKVTPSMGYSFLFTMSSLVDHSEKYRSGIMLGLGITKCEWQADFATNANNVGYTLWAKSNLFDLQAGYEGSFRVTEALSIDFDIAPYLLIPLGPRTRVERTVGSTLSPDGDADQWHEGDKSASVSAPSIDIGALARVAANYHFTDKMWAGLAFQYRLAFVNFADLVSDQYSHDGYRYSGSYMQYSDMKHRGWSLMLTVGIDFE